MPRPSALALLAILAEDLDDIVAYLDQSHYRFGR